ncbi:LysR substrate-binding domain-containing protein, partial [Bordetella hinzii]|nr:LysR substrate-binding domain-containing protein [Bordetella hinzii]
PGRYAAWVFRGADGLLAIEMKETVRVTDTDAYVAAGLAGLGLIRVAGYMVREHLAEGRLVRLLDTAEAPSEPISILYPQSRHLSPAVRAFIDWSSDVIASLSA